MEIIAFGNAQPDELAADLSAALGEPVTVTVIPPDALTLHPLGPADPAILDQVASEHRSTQHRNLDQLVEKARRVWNGQDTFTQAQAQKILAGLVLLENRRR